MTLNKYGSTAFNVTSFKSWKLIIRKPQTSASEAHTVLQMTQNCSKIQFFVSKHNIKDKKIEIQQNLRDSYQN